MFIIRFGDMVASFRSHSEAIKYIQELVQTHHEMGLAINPREIKLKYVSDNQAVCCF